MELIKPGIEVNFIRYRLIFLIISSVLFLASIISFFYPGPNWGIDFKGGTEMRVRFLKEVAIGKIRASVSELGLGEVQIQSFKQASLGSEKSEGKDFLIRVEALSGSKEKLRPATLIEDRFKKDFGENSFLVLNVEYVGPRVGRELREKGVQAMIYAMIGILLYVAFRFEFRYALGAVLALVHDTIITAGFYIFFHREWSLAIIAALLTIIGYSVNDTIVVYDRIRESIRRGRRGTFKEIVNRSINETLSRTVLTSFTTLLAVLFLYIFGGGVIRDFSLVLLVGIIVGTYSSIYIASSLVVFLDDLRAKRSKAKKK